MYSCMAVNKHIGWVELAAQTACLMNDVTSTDLASFTPTASYLSNQWEVCLVVGAHEYTTFPHITNFTTL